jgi:hypothetical protein
MDDAVSDYLSTHHAAAMIAVRPDGSPHAVRCGIALVDGKLWSSGTQTRRRTAYLRQDPRCTLFVFGSSPEDQYSYLSLDTRVTIHDASDAPEMNAQLFTVMQAGMNPPAGTLFWYGKPLGRDEFLQTMVDEQRLIYEFEVTRSYGLF